MTLRHLSYLCFFFLATSSKAQVSGLFPPAEDYGEVSWEDDVFKAFYPNGKLAVRGTMKDSLRQDRWFVFHKNGNINKVVNFENGKLEGPFILYDENEIRISETYYEAGIKTGGHAEYYETGQLALSGFYKAGQMDSVWTEYSPYGFKIYEKEYAKGLANGTWKYYHEESSTIQAIEQYKFDVEEGRWSTYYRSGKLEKEFFFRDGLLHGPYVEYHGNQGRSVVGEYSYGLKTGKWLNVYRNGQVYSVGNYARNEKVGLWKYFRDNGKLESEGPFANDLKQGQWILYHENESLRAVGSYQRDKKDGLWGYFYENEQLQQEQTWKEGRLMSSSTFYTIKGEPLAQGTLSYGTGTYFEYHPEGQIKLEASLKDGYFDKDFVTYHEGGKIASKGQMSNSLEEGLWEYFYPSGRIESKGSFSKGERVGEWSYFNPRQKLVEKIEY